ncbi:Fe(2+) transporter, variant 2 [Ascochyta rabiei]|uniref:Fe(2+) transporter, variant 2 n=1 Tax=Didymella rabiei TaxID=5454 RepID=UPI002206AE93|nr:Fe(2+) transporter, variant 2 [Ascochyta rabiei]UPX19162.1 Fe(2+) transporter, variant 2 [Ascochyta rabiei]
MCGTLRPLVMARKPQKWSKCARASSDTWPYESESVWAMRRGSWQRNVGGSAAAVESSGDIVTPRARPFQINTGIKTQEMTVSSPPPGYPDSARPKKLQSPVPVSTLPPPSWNLPPSRPARSWVAMIGQQSVSKKQSMSTAPGRANSCETRIADLRHSYEALPPNFSLGANMLAGAFAGIAEHSVMYPVDMLKTRMQVINPGPTATYQNSIANALVTVSRAEGFRSLWKGLSSVILGAGPAHAVYFASYEAAKHALGGNEGESHEHHPLAAAASGAAATITSDALMNPFDVIKQRMQLHGSIYTSVSHCARDVFRKEGIGAFYVSYPTTLCMTVPFTALQFMSYESISKVMNPTGRYDPYTHCFAGGLAGGFAAALTTPLDVIKTLLQTRGSARDVELRTVSGLLQAAKIIHQREGYKGYFRGLKPRIITTMPSTAICWSAYEMAKAFFIARSTNPNTAL